MGVAHLPGMALNDFYRTCPTPPKPSYAFGQTPDGTPRPRPAEMENGVQKVPRSLAPELRTSLESLPLGHSIEVNAAGETYNLPLGWQGGAGEKLHIERTQLGYSISGTRREFSVEIPAAAAKEGGSANVGDLRFRSPKDYAPWALPRHILTFPPRAAGMPTQLIFRISPQDLSQANRPLHDPHLSLDLLKSSKTGRGITAKELKTSLKKVASDGRDHSLPKTAQLSLLIATDDLKFATKKTRQLALDLGRGRTPAQMGVVVGKAG